MAETAALSPSSLPQSSTGLLRGDQRAGSFVAAHDDFQQFLGGGQRQLPHAEVIDDEQRHSGEQFHVFFAFAVQCGVGQLFQQDVRFAIQHAIALLDDGMSDGLGQVTFAGPGWTAKQRSLRVVRIQPAVARSKIRLRFILALNWKSKLSRRLSGSRNCSLLVAALQQPLAAAFEFVRYQHGDQIDGRHGIGLSLQQTCFQARRPCRSGAIAAGRD